MCTTYKNTSVWAPHQGTFSYLWSRLRSSLVISKFFCIFGKCKSQILQCQNLSLYLLRDVFIFTISYVLEVTRKLTREIKEENMKAIKENSNHIRDDIACVMEQLSLLNEKVDGRLRQSEERSTQGQKSIPVDLGETLGQLVSVISVYFFAFYLCFMFAI